MQDICGKESNADEILPTDLRYNDGEEAAGDTDIRDRDLLRESDLARENASTVSPAVA